MRTQVYALLMIKEESDEVQTVRASITGGFFVS